MNARADHDRRAPEADTDQTASSMAATPLIRESSRILLVALSKDALCIASIRRPACLNAAVAASKCRFSLHHC